MSWISQPTQDYFMEDLLHKNKEKKRLHVKIQSTLSAYQAHSWHVGALRQKTAS